MGKHSVSDFPPVPGEDPPGDLPEAARRVADLRPALRLQLRQHRPLALLAHPLHAAQPGGRLFSRVVRFHKESDSAMIGITV